ESIEVGFGVTSVNLVNEHGDAIVKESPDETPNLTEDTGENQVETVEKAEEAQIDSIDTSTDSHTSSEQEE
ncbi:MAG: hypothetical protein KAT16_11000, partial [Candidatus Heimdallarchaeota archaeon]|nr:hypothetical protein [Candidatus Heimdallarchaeota archaeon]